MSLLMNVRQWSGCINMQDFCHVVIESFVDLIDPEHSKGHIRQCKQAIF